jgi:uracil-DNA glycosylase
MPNTYTDIPDSWSRYLSEIIDQPYMKELNDFLQTEEKTQTVYPPSDMVYNAFKQTPFDTVKVVILGQDPYHGPGQAHGLCFSVQHGVRPPPSLVNMYKEIEQDLGHPRPSHGNLTEWAEQGVLLLNTTLTVREKEPKSHAGHGWESFTDSVIEVLNKEKEHIVFLLWGAHAQSKETLIDSDKHCILKTTHPSPFSAYRGFLGSNHFSLCNNYLVEQGQQPIDWRVTDKDENVNEQLTLF